MGFPIWQFPSATSFRRPHCPPLKPAQAMGQIYFPHVQAVPPPTSRASLLFCVYKALDGSALYETSWTRKACRCVARLETRSALKQHWCCPMWAPESAPTPLEETAPVGIGIERR